MTRTKKMPTKIPARLSLVAELTLAAADSGQDEDGNEEVKPRRFDMLANTGDVMELGFFGRIVVDMDGLKIPKGSLPILQQHDPNLRAGFSASVEKGGGNLRIKGELLDNEVGAAIARDADQGFPWQASIGFRISEAEFVDDDEKREVNGKKLSGPLLVATKSRLLESSFTPNGADSKTAVVVLSEDEGGVSVKRAKNEPTEEPVSETKLQEARDAGDKAAVGRLQTMMSAFPGRLKFAVDQFLAGSDVTAAKATLADQLVEEVKAQDEKIAKLEAAAASGHAGVPVNANAGQGGSGAASTEAQIEAKLRKEWDSDPKLRQLSVFGGDFEKFKRTQLAEGSGQIASEGATLVMSLN